MIRRLVLAGFVASAFAAGAWGASPLRAARPSVVPENCVPAGQRISFRTADRIRLSGAVIGTGKVGVVLAHQSNQDYCGWVPFAKTLAAHGYRSLAFSFRNHGSSGREEVPNQHHDRDVIAAAAELRRRGCDRIFLMGASLGGTAVVTAAPTIRPAVAGVLDLSGPAEFTDLDALAAARRLIVPVVFAVSRFDSMFVPGTRAMFRASPSKDKRLVIRPGGEHGTALLEGKAAAFMRPLALGFIRAHARG